MDLGKFRHRGVCGVVGHLEDTGPVRESNMASRTLRAGILAMVIYDGLCILEGLHKQGAA